MSISMQLIIFVLKSLITEVAPFSMFVYAILFETQRIEMGDVLEPLLDESDADSRDNFLRFTIQENRMKQSALNSKNLPMEVI
jgi:hypothetical protein